MPSNIPVSTLSAALSLDVSGFESGVKRAEMLSIRWAKTQQETFAALGNPGSQITMTEGWLRDIEKASRASERLFSSVTGPRSTGLPTAQSSALAEAAAAEEEAMRKSRMAALRMDADRMAALEQAAATKRMKIEEIRNQASQVRDKSAFDLASPFEQQVMASTKLNGLLQERRALQRGSIEFAQKELEIARQIATVRSLRSDLTITDSGLRRLGNTAADSQDRMRQFNLRILQGGYQLQDFVVQVGSGTNAMVAFAQQSSQFAGFFGATGAWVGVGLAVAALAANLLIMGANAKDSAGKVKTLREETDGLLQARRELLELTMGERAEKSFATGDVRAAQAEVNALDAQIAAKKKAVEEYNQKLRNEAAAGPNIAMSAAIARGTQSAPLGPTEEDYAKRAAAMKALTEAQKKHAQVFDETADASNRASDASLEYFTSVRQARRENAQFGETALQTLDRLREEWSVANAFGPQDPLQIEKLRHDILSVESALSKEAQAIEDQLDPLAKKRRELEQIRKLEEGGFLAEGTLNRFTARLEDEMRQKVKLPDSFTFSGAQSSGGMVGSGQQNIMVDLTRKMLTELTQIKASTYTMAGNN